MGRSDFVVKWRKWARIVIPGWLGKYQETVNEVIVSLGGDDEASKQYTEVAKTWNEVEPPEELKRK